MLIQPRQGSATYSGRAVGEQHLAADQADAAAGGAGPREAGAGRGGGTRLPPWAIAAPFGAHGKRLLFEVEDGAERGVDLHELTRVEAAREVAEALRVDGGSLLDQYPDILAE